jgi:hypothetical protein
VWEEHAFFTGMFLAMNNKDVTWIKKVGIILENDGAFRAETEEPSC